MLSLRLRLGKLARAFRMIILSGGQESYGPQFWVKKRQGPGYFQIIAVDR